MRTPTRQLLLTGALTLSLAGCTAPAASPPVAARDVVVDVEGQQRSYRLFAPESATGDPRPLVIAIHGLGQTGNLLAPATGYDALAKEHGFLVVYPDAINRVWNTRLPAGVGELPDDVAFLATLIDEVDRAHPVDRARVYATGHSDGARMAYRLGCERADVFAAVAPVAGGMTQPCRPTRPLAVLQVKGEDDQLALAEAAGAVDTMRKLNRCEHVAVERVDAARVERYTGCRSAVEVASVVVPGIGHHIWPTAADGYDTTAHSWTFLSRFSLQPAP